MDTIYTGGPAFPRPASEYTVSGTLADGNDAIREQDGMSLRDYFAAKALQGLCAMDRVDMSVDATAQQRKECLEGIAFDCYALADAMLRARGETP